MPLESCLDEWSLSGSGTGVLPQSLPSISPPQFKPLNTQHMSGIVLAVLD
jgi:hypothetical protein